MICFTVIEYKYHIVSKEITAYHSFQAEPFDSTRNTSTAIITAAALTSISLPIMTNLSAANITFSVRTNTSAAIITNASAAIITNASAAIITNTSAAIITNTSAAIITNASAAIRTNTSAVNSSNEVILKTEEELRNYFVQTPYIFDKFTIVTPTYKRTDNLYRLFDTYCPITDIIHKILILWNNVGESIPEKVIEYAKKCTIPVIFKIMERNNLTSRFIPFTDIETAGMYNEYLLCTYAHCLAILHCLLLRQNQYNYAHKFCDNYFFFSVHSSLFKRTLYPFHYFVCQDMYMYIYYYNS